MDEKLLKSVDALLSLAYLEDIGEGDITTNNLILSSENKTALFVAKEDGVIAGLPVAETVFRKLETMIILTLSLELFLKTYMMKMY